MSRSKAEIERLLSALIRPQLELHNGNIRLVSLEDDVLRLSLTGQCATCMMADQSTNVWIRETLLAQMPELKEIEISQYVSDELLQIARDILRRGRE